jgi:hypothetical protein
MAARLNLAGPALSSWAALAILAATCAPRAAGQESEPAPRGFPGLAADRRPQVEIPWNRLYDVEELDAHCARLAERWPDWLRAESIGRSSQGRPLRVWILTDPATGPDQHKPGMWIDGNVHGNEVQAAETVLYTAWYLLENRDSNARVRELLERVSFYLLPSVNPDGRAAWFAGPANASTHRSGQAPEDDDRDGLFDEDPPDDLDGDGQITQMRQHTPGRGTHRLDPEDPRLLVRVERDAAVRGDWTLLGSEGLDNDGDGRVNEDSTGGYDMNRAWPSGWQPEHVQGGAGPYPLAWPETRAVADFLLSRPNVAGVQSFHNAGGMILRGPGHESYGEYPRADVAVYDELGADGEALLPHYEYWVIWRDLYTVYGGFVNWTYEGLGIFSFTNELWTDRRKSPDGRIADDAAGRHRFDDLLLMSAGFSPWKQVEHPLYGAVEVGGFAKDVGRVPPSFLLEEELHRNALFCLRHAEALPWVEIDEPTILELGDGWRAIDVRLRNRALIPTRSALAAEKGLGLPDNVELVGAGLEIAASGERLDPHRPERLELTAHEPQRVVLEAGLPSRGERTLRFVVRGSGPATLHYRGEQVADVARNFALP